MIYKASSPKKDCDGIMDLVCVLSSGGKALVEMQVVPQDHWDKRVLSSGGKALVEMQVGPQDHWDKRALAYEAKLCIAVR